MAFGIKYVPISPGMYNQGPQATFPDLNTFVPISEEVLMRARQNVEEFLSYALLEDKQNTYPLEPAPDAVSSSESESIETTSYDESEEYFKFLMEHDGHLSSHLPSPDGPFDSAIDSPGSASFPEDMSWDFSQGVFQQPEIWDPTPDLEALISSTEYMDQATLDSLHKSLEEFESVFYGKGPPTSAFVEA